MNLTHPKLSQVKMWLKFNSPSSIQTSTNDLGLLVWGGWFRIRLDPLVERDYYLKVPWSNPKPTIHRFDPFGKIAKNRARSAGSWKNSSLLMSACHCSLQGFCFAFSHPKKASKSDVKHVWDAKWLKSDASCLICLWCIHESLLIFNHHVSCIITNFNHTLRPTYENQGHEQICQQFWPYWSTFWLCQRH